ncbi:MAG: MATE family efflux transporter [Polaromonas sp.]|nr:MATE family efflux transporter [Polaromonas sp.]
MKELKIIGKHASTVLVGQLAIMAFGVADTVIAGRYSDTALAALSVGSAIYISVYVGLIGIIQALLPIWAEMRGARQHHAVGQSIRQSLYLCGLISMAGIGALLFPGPLLQWAKIPAAMQGEVQAYLAVLALAFVPALLFRLFSTLNQALGKPVLITWLQIGALVVKIPLSIWFVAGGGGLDAMGAVGCAWATLVVNYLLLLLAVLLLRTNALYLPYRIWARMEKPDWRQIRSFARLGLPAGLAYMVEVTSFTLMALFIARLGTVAAASHQIAASLAAVLYMVPLSLAIACSARVSFWIGAGEPAQARRVVGLALSLSALSASALALLLWLMSQQIPAWYSRNPEVVLSASTLLAWVAVYHLADSLQAVCAFLLRCYRITLMPLLIYGVLLWGFGLTGGYFLAYVGTAGMPASQLPASFWTAATAALTAVACCFLTLLWRASRQAISTPPSTFYKK